MTEPLNKTAYSYIRYSSAIQEEGDSLRRQTEAAIAFCKENDLVLSQESYQDLGVSSYRSKNVHEGQLRRFLNACEAGQIERGSTLIVENLDRISRAEIIDAVSVFLDLIKYVNIGIAQLPYKLYTKKDINESPISLMEIQLTFIRANEESLAKSKRLGAAWMNKKRNASSESPITSRVPAWLELKDGKIVEIEERSLIVQEIFDKCCRGVGIYSITKDLNDRGVAPFGRAKMWHASYVSKILHNIAVYGIYQPYTKKDVVEKNNEGSEVIVRKRVEDGDPIENYYPVVVSKNKFYRAKHCLSSRSGEAGRKGGKTALTQNLFTHMLKDGVSGNSIQFANKGQNKYIIPSGCKEGTLGYYVSWEYNDFERILFEELSSSPREIVGIDEEKETIEEDRVDEITVELGDLKKIQDRLVAAIETGRSISSVAKRLEEVEEKMKELYQELEKETVGHFASTYEEYKEFMDRYKNAADKIRESVELREKFRRVILSQYEDIQVWFEGRFPRWNADRAKIATILKERGKGYTTADKIYLRKLVELHKSLREVTYKRRGRPELHAAFDHTKTGATIEMYKKLVATPVPENLDWTSVFLEDMKQFMSDADSGLY